MATMMMTTSRTATTATATTTPTDELDTPPETEVWFPFVGINDESPPVMWCICDDFLMVESHYIMLILPPVAASSIV